MQRPAALTVLSALALAACGGSSASTSPRGDTGGAVEGGVAESGGPGTTSPMGGNGSDAGTDAAAPPPKGAPLASMGTLVVLGDSISQGGGQPPFYYDLLLSNDDTTYPAWAGKDVRTKYGANVMMVNNAVAGAVSQDLPDPGHGAPVVAAGTGGRGHHHGRQRHADQHRRHSPGRRPERSHAVRRQPRQRAHSAHHAGPLRRRRRSARLRGGHLRSQRRLRETSRPAPTR